MVTHYVKERLGLKCIGEYPTGVVGNRDVDSGPVIWGVGTAATLVSQRAIVKNGDYDFAEEINNGIEAMGFPSTSSDSKKYLGGYLDIGDVFIAWTRSAATPEVETAWWQFYFQLWCLVIMASMNCYVTNHFKQMFRLSKSMSMHISMDVC